MEVTLTEPEVSAHAARVRAAADGLYLLTAAGFFLYLFIYYWTTEGGPALLALVLVPVAFVPLRMDGE